MSLKLVPFVSLGAVSYSPSIVTKVVSVAICDIFSVKEWCDLENGVRGGGGKVRGARREVRGGKMRGTGAR